MNYTQNYHLGLPIPAERYDVSIVNANNTVIDGQLKTNADAITNHKNDHNNPHAVTAAQVGLGNVNNTSDANKPVSTAQAQYVTQAVSAESTRAQGVESTLSGQISAEVTRATSAESTLADNLSAEITRATGIEDDLVVMISTETTRAQGAESDLRDYVDEKLSVTYKASGSVFFADLPALAASREGHVYNIKDDFTTTIDFVEGAGKDYSAGTNVAIIEKDEESYEEATVEETDNPSEMGLYELDGSDYVLTADTSPVEGKTYYELTTTPSYLYDVFAGFIDTSDFVTDTDYATTQKAGLVKPDGTTITVDANGVISSQGGGDVSAEEMADVVNILGAKNYINSLNVDNNIDHATVKSLSDGVLHVYGAIDQEATIWDNSILISSTTMPDGDYILSDGINNDRSKISIFAAIEGTVVAMTHSTQYRNTFHLQGNNEVGFYVYGGQGFDDDIYVYPMCRPEHIENETYVPYAKTNRQLTEDVETLQQTTFSDMTGATSSSDGTHGLVPAPLIADRGKFLRGDGAWQNIPNMTGATSTANGASGLVPQPLIANRAQFLRGDGAWATPTIEKSYVGMIIHSTTLNTMAKVVAFYGGTTWIQHSGYVLRGATSGVTANSAAKTGGADSVTLTNSQMPSHRHTMAYDNSGAHYLPKGYGPNAVQNGWADANSLKGNGAFSDSASGSSGGAVIQPTGGGQAHSTLPNYKSVYIWERTV